ncbi:hypothetical protein TVAG_410440 [Trichomonas vaginalis G3]|uniref:Uncharacterized protein n=1 Tax=Trichomonas vaginalis (strain ATCC PRA-98 / G3) TaxID=412133 RepID=A2E8K4_TRIV3|nr:spectrin binding [Trichomonas vaginalis G3]EAY11041.1 hypothetical protein TVAG_410440 [Trichomonas vaginalis G3]KAI5531785.1 spectrin binding [Trichomonas vaginalis G3]|eukprot:XP_001323264.1 hypothetical protein [Trichomonas vaginalis G3]
MEIPEELKTAIELQDKIMSISVENAKEVADYIISSEFFDDDRINSTVDFILSYCISQPKKVHAYAEMFKHLINKNKDVAIIVTYTSIFRSENRLPYELLKDDIIPLNMFVKAADEVKKQEALFWVAPQLANIPELDLGFSSFIPLPKEIYAADNWKVYKQFLESGFIPDSFGDAIYHDNVEVLQKVMEKEGFNIDEPLIWIYAKRLPIIYNPQPIDLAAFLGSKNCFKVLLEKGAKVDEKTVIMAISGNCTDLAKQIEDKIVKIDNSMLMAAKYHNIEAMEWLSSKGANYPDLFHTIDSYNFRAMLFSLNHGADAKKHDDQGITATRLAAQGGIPGALKYLAKLGAEVGIEEYSIALCNDDRCYLIPVLVELGVDPNMKTDEGIPLIVDSLGNNCLASAKVAFACGGDPNSVLPNGVNILSIAAQNNAVDAVKLLLEVKADVNKENKDGTKPIHFARSKEVMEVLLNAGADVNAKDRMGGTPIFFAVAEKRLDDVKYLISKCADKNVKAGPAKISLLDMARKVGAKDIEKYIRSLK